MTISVIGLLFELYQPTADLCHFVKEKHLVIIQNLSSAAIFEHEQQIHDGLFLHETLTPAKKCGAIHPGVIMIYPSIICSLYGFVNEESWTFNSAIGGCNFVLLIASVAVDLLYEKSNLIWLLYKITVSHLKKSTAIVAVIIVSAIIILVQWLVVLVGIGIRIYADNFAIKNITDYSDNVKERFENVTGTGDYSSTPLTRYAVFAANITPVTLFFYTAFLARSRVVIQNIQLKASLTKRLYHILLHTEDKLSHIKDLKFEDGLYTVNFIYMSVTSFLSCGWVCSAILCTFLSDYANPREATLPVHMRTISFWLLFFPMFLWALFFSISFFFITLTLISVFINITAFIFGQDSCVRPYRFTALRKLWNK